MVVLQIITYFTHPMYKTYDKMPYDKFLYFDSLQFTKISLNKIAENGPPTSRTCYFEAGDSYFLLS